MRDFILKYWLEIIFGAAVSALSCGYARLRARMKRQKSIERGILALLHDRLYQACSGYLEAGRCEIDGKKNLEYMFLPYKELGGKGTAEAMYRQCLELPAKGDKQNEKSV